MLYFKLIVSSLIFLIFLLIYYFCFQQLKKWLTLWKINPKIFQSILLTYKSLIFFFLISFMIYNLVIFSNFISPYGIFYDWIKTIYLFPSYIWALTHFIYILIYILFILSFRLSAKSFQILLKITYKNKKSKLKNLKILQNPSKRIWLKKSIFTLPSSLLIFNSINAYSTQKDFVINKMTISINNLPKDLKGFSITQISDLHFGPFMDEFTFEQFLKPIQDLNSDIIVLTGDIINDSPQFIPSVTRSLSQLQAQKGVFACLGNHEYYTGIQQIIPALENINIKVLINNSYLIQHQNTQLYLLGVDYPIKSSRFFQNRKKLNQNLNTNQLIHKNLKETIQTTQYPYIPKVLLSHHPNTFNYSQKYNIDLILAGHTHGGQIVLSQNPYFNFIPLNNLFPYIKGYYSKNQSQLYVNSGLGHWFPFRLNCPREITQIILN